MRKLTIYAMSALLLLGAAATSCTNDFEQPPVVYPEGGIGNGDWDNPLTAYQAHLGTVVEGKSTVWVTGYIVGWIDTTNGNQVMFTTEGAANTNMVIAMTPDETDPANCTSVQLPSGGVRNALNLADHPGNLGELVTIKGTTGEKYCGIYGVRSVSAYNWGDKGIYEEPAEPVVPVGQLYCNFEKSTEISYYTERGWTNVAERGGLSGFYIRNFSGNNYATVSATNGSQYGGPYINWLITPPIDMSLMTDKTLTFRTQGAYGHDGCSFEAYVLTSDDPAKATATLLPAKICTPQPDGASPVYSDWMESGKIDLSGFSGVIYIGFKYTAKEGGMGFCSTYCVDDINIGNASTTEPVDPSKISEFKKVTTLTSGKQYLIVSDGNMAKPLTSTYGYLLTGKVEEKDGVITLNDSENAFTFEQTEGGWYIRQANGKYLCQIGTYNSFNVADSAMSDGTLFRITAEADGTFRIVNLNVNKTMEYAPSFNNFASNATVTGSLPMLYEKVEK